MNLELPYVLSSAIAPEETAIYQLDSQIFSLLLMFNFAGNPWNGA